MSTQKHWVSGICPSSGIPSRKHNVSDLGLLPSSDDGSKKPTLLGPLGRASLNHCYKGPNRVDVSLPSHEDGNGSIFRNFVFSSYLEFRTMDTAQKPSHSECYTPNRNPSHSTSRRTIRDMFWNLPECLSRPQDRSLNSFPRNIMQQCYPPEGATRCG
jgi:hypothetical protein